MMSDLPWAHQYVKNPRGSGSRSRLTPFNYVIPGVPRSAPSGRHHSTSVLRTESRLRPVAKTVQKVLCPP